MNHVEATGKTIEDAVRSGLVQLGLTRDEVTVEVLSEPKSGFLGIGSKPAVVRVTAKEEAEHVLQRQQEDVRKAEEAEKQAADAAGIAEAEPPCPEEPVSAPAESEIDHPADGAKDSVAASPADEAADQKEDFTAEEAAAKASVSPAAWSFTGLYPTYSSGCSRSSCSAAKRKELLTHESCRSDRKND